MCSSALRANSPARLADGAPSADAGGGNTRDAQHSEANARSSVGSSSHRSASNTAVLVASPGRACTSTQNRPLVSSARGTRVSRHTWAARSASAGWPCTASVSGSSKPRR